MSEPLTGTCERCDRGGLTPGDGSPDARLLKRARQGYCAGCAMTEFLKVTPPLNEQLDRLGVERLLEPMIQTAALRLLQSGKADARPEEIDWTRVVANWDLPLSKAVEREIARQKREW